jgi:alkanesulfonate monooxygenase SsuD/methylene tetrahydromethanopterin reductase-like flavin-dependent oxidoreductase (luciferase family)
MKDYREEVLKHAVAYGRDPKNVKLLFTCTPTVVKDARDAAETREAATKMRAAKWEHGLATLSFMSGIDFSKYDMDGPIGEIRTNGMQTILRMFNKFGPQATLRQILTAGPVEAGLGAMIGTADQIAGRMQEAMQDVGGDGFLITGHFKPKFVASITDELVPQLQKRNLVRTEYTHENFRDNLLAF